MRQIVGVISLCMVFFGGIAQEFNATLPLGNKLKVGEPLDVELVFRYPSNSNTLPILRELEDNTYLSGEIEILESEDPTVIDDGAVIEMRKLIRITVWEQGEHNIPPFSVYYAGDSLYSNSLEISTPEIKVNLKNAPKDIKGIYEADWSIWDELVFWLNRYWWVLLLIGVLIVAAIWFKKYLTRRKENSIAPLSEMKAEELAYLMLTKIEEAETWKKGEIKVYYTHISEVLWKYLEMHFDVSTADQTSLEILNNVKKTEIPKERIKELQDIFRSADLVKFAKSNPSSQEHELILLKTRKFVDQTKHIPYRDNEK